MRVGVAFGYTQDRQDLLFHLKRTYLAGGLSL